MLGEVDVEAKDHIMSILENRSPPDNPSRFAVNCVKNAFEALGVQMPH
jgi:hypothetical protein